MAQPLSATPARPGNITYLTEKNPTKIIDIVSRHILFEVRRDLFKWVSHNDIMFVKSADHYVNALVQDGTNKKWMMRHSTLKEIFVLLTKDDFVRLNRFYLVNRKQFSHIDFSRKYLFLLDGTQIPVSHRISPFIVESLKEK